VRQLDELAAKIRTEAPPRLLRLGVVSALSLALVPPTVTVDGLVMRLTPSAGVLKTGDTVVWANQGATPFVLGKLSGGANIDGIYTIGFGGGAPVYQNSWGISAGYEHLHYWKDSNGIVHLKGLSAGGVRGTTITTLPAGYRPTANHRCVDISSTTVFGTNEVQTDGDVLATGGGSAGFFMVDTEFYAGF
jgi:hypothetical protein